MTVDAARSTDATVLDEDERAGRRSARGSSADAWEERERAGAISRALAVLPPQMQRKLADPHAVISPLVVAEQAKKMEEAFQALCDAVLTPDDYALYEVRKQRVGPNGTIQEYTAIELRKRKSAWRKIGRYTNLDVEITREVIGHVHREQTCARILMAKHGLSLGPDEDCSCDTTYARYHVKVTGWNGRTGVGVGIASRNERGFKAQDHSIPATAYSRAVSRAISDIVGAGEGSSDDPAETMDAPKGEPAPRPVGESVALTPEQVKLYTGAWGKASDDQRRQTRAHLHELGYQDNFLATGARDLDRILELLGATSPESAPT